MKAKGEDVEQYRGDISAAVMNTDQNQLERGREVLITAHYRGSQGRNHGGRLLTGLLSVACSACFLTRPQDHLPRRGPSHNRLDPLTSIPVY